MTPETIGMILGIAIKVGLVIWAQKRGWGKLPWLVWGATEVIGFVMVVGAAIYVPQHMIPDAIEVTGLLSFLIGAAGTIWIVVMICKPKNKKPKYINE